MLFIAVDDLRPDFGCYGNKEVKSPNLDRLAGEGLLFQRAYCQFPLCMPSRASVFRATVRKASRELAGLPGMFLPAPFTLPQLFRNHGYVTVSAGHYNMTRRRGGLGEQFTDLLERGQVVQRLLLGIPVGRESVPGAELSPRQRRGLPCPCH